MAVVFFLGRQAADTSPSALQPVLSKFGLSALMWIEIGFCIGFVVLRTWVQFQNTKKFYGNDLLLVFALICHLLAAIVYQLALPIMYKLEKEKDLLALERPPAEDLTDMTERYLRYYLCLLILLWVTLWAVKFSLLLFFWRMFDSIHSRVRMFWWLMTALTASTFLVALFVQLFACDSPANLIRIDGCSTQRHVYLNNLAFQFAAGSDIGLDVAILLIPFPLLRKLQVASRQKLILAAIFLLPCIPIVFAILKFILVNPKSGPVNTIKFQLYYMLENSAAIITACIPSLRLFIYRPSVSARRGPAGPTYYYSDSELKTIRKQTSAISSRKNYNPFLPKQPLRSDTNVAASNPFLPKQSGYRSQIQPSSQSRPPTFSPSKPLKIPPPKASP